MPQTAQLPAQPSAYEPLLAATAPTVPIPDADTARQLLDGADRATEIMGTIGDGAGEVVSRAASLIEQLPWEAHIVAVLGLVAGILLWAFGRRLVRLAAGGFGAWFGAFAGVIMIPTIFGPTIASVPTSLIGLLGGAVAGIVLALVILRTFITIASGTAFAVLGLLAGLVYVEYTTPPAPPTEPDQAQVENPALRTDLSERSSALREDPTRPPPADPEADPGDEGPLSELDEQTREAVNRIREVTAQAWDALVERWNGLTIDQQAFVGGGTLVGAALGVLLGIVFPKRSTSFVTAMTGAAVGLFSLAWLIEASGLGWLKPAINHQPDRWVIIWVITAAIGLFLQLRKRRKKSDKDGDGQAD